MTSTSNQLIKNLRNSFIFLFKIKIVFSLLFGGSMPHYFYKLMEKTLVGRTKLNQVLFLGCERLLYTPLFQAISLYLLAIFEVRALLNSNTRNWLNEIYIVILFVFREKVMMPQSEIYLRYTGLC